MDLFGLKEHDQRHAEVERQIRHLPEQVARLTIERDIDLSPEPPMAVAPRRRARVN